jgi:putative ABC transport system permease protein
VRAATSQVTQVAAMLAAQADPAAPEQVSVSQPSDALTAQLAVQRSGTGLFLGLGAIALLVGSIGIANVMVVAVLERRGEIGLRRALGATRCHITAQFLTESVILGASGGIAGVALGAAAAVTMAYLHNWQTVLPGEAICGGLGIAAAAGMAAGLYPALRAARLPPTEALRTP